MMGQPGHHRPPKNNNRVKMAVAAPFCVAPGWPCPRRRQQRTLPLKAISKTLLCGRQHDKQRARGLAVSAARRLAPAHVDVDVGPCLHPGPGTARSEFVVPSLHFAAPDTSPRASLAFAPGGKKGTLISGHSGTIGPSLFYPASPSPQSAKKGKRRTEVHTYVYARARRDVHLGLCRPLVARRPRHAAPAPPPTPTDPPRPL